VATIIRRVGLTTGFIGSHTVTHNYSSLTHLPSLHTVSSLAACLPISQGPFDCNSSLKTAARPEYSLVTGTVHVTLTLYSSLLRCQLTLQQLLLPQPGPSIHSLARHWRLSSVTDFSAQLLTLN
jgi:hypothetical protein